MKYLERWRSPSPVDEVPPPPQYLQPQQVKELPVDLMHRIFALVIIFADDPAPVMTLSLVCKRWQGLAQHSYICELIAKKFLVSYPLLRLRGELPTAVLSELIREGNMKSKRKTPDSFLASPAHRRTLSRPTPEKLRLAAQEIAQHTDDLKYRRVVARRRGYVMHTLASLALFFFAAFLTITMCTLEDLDPITLNNPTMAFGCLWGAYLSVLGAIIANVVIEAHFDPQPLVPRIQRNLTLIVITTSAIGACASTVALPTWMVQRNVFRESEELVFEWRTCSYPFLLLMGLWQLEAIHSKRHDLWAWLRSPDRESLYTGSAHICPTLFALTVLSTFEFVASMYWPYLIVASIPIFITLFILAIVFLMDFATSHRREAEGIASVCLILAAAFPVCLVAFPIRGYSLLPAVFALWGFFSGHMWETRKSMEAAYLDEEDDDM